MKSTFWVIRLSGGKFFATNSFSVERPFYAHMLPTRTRAREVARENELKNYQLCRVDYTVSESRS